MTIVSNKPEHQKNIIDLTVNAAIIERKVVDDLFSMTHMEKLNILMIWLFDNNEKISKTA